MIDFSAPLKNVITFVINLIKLSLKYICIVLCLGIMSCSQDNIYNQKQRVNDPWKYGEPLSFKYEVTDTVPAFDMVISIEHNATFSYENIYLNTTTFFPNGKSTTNPVSFQLADNKGGWLGKCSGDNCSIEIEMSSGAFFKIQGKYKLIFDQFSREDSLKGIRSIGIRVQKTKK